MKPMRGDSRVAGLKWCLLALLLVALPSWATFQVREQLMLDGQQLELVMLPLAPWLEIPGHAIPESSIVSTANWRGYRGRWEIRDGRLWLVKLAQDVPGPPTKTQTVGLNQGPDGELRQTEPSESEVSWPVERDITPLVSGAPGPVPATWFSGTLVAVHDDATCLKRYGSDLPCYLVLWIDKGEAGRRVELDLAQFYQFQCDRFAAYKQTPAYAERLREASEYAGDDAERSVYDSASPYYLGLDGAASAPLDPALCRRLND